MQKKLNKAILDQQSKHLVAEHKILRDNLESLQKTLEQFFDEEHELRIQLAPVSNEIMVSKFTEGIDQMIVEKKKNIDAEKGLFCFCFPFFSFFVISFLFMKLTHLSFVFLFFW